jgi:phosphoglucomutase
VQAVANAQQKQKLAKLSSDEIELDSLAGSKVVHILDKAPGNGAPIGGIKVIAEHGWFAARPSGTEDIYKIYAESFRDRQHLDAILAEAQQVVDKAIS